MLLAMDSPLGMALALHRAAITAAPEQTHPALYETCAALIIAVLVVIYFDERVRHGLTLRMRGYAIGSLGGVIGIGLLTPLFALAGFINDTPAVRWFTVIYTMLFLVTAFGAAIRMWGLEDGHRLRSTEPQRVPQPPLPPLPRGGQSERERAAEVLGAAMATVSHTHPAAVVSNLARNGVEREAERLRNLSAHWITLEPYLVAVSAGYASAAVRGQTSEFIKAASEAMRQTAVLFADSQALATDEAKAQRQEQATPAYEALQVAFDAVVSALHADDGSNGRSPQSWVKSRRVPVDPDGRRQHS